MKRLLISLVMCLPISTAFAVVSTFNDIALDGEGSSPFIRFDVTGQSSKFIVGFNDNFGFWTGSSYSVRLYSSAPSDALVVESAGVSVKKSFGITDDDGTIEAEFTHSGTSQTTGVVSLSSAVGLNGGGIGFKVDSASFPFYVFDTANTQAMSIREEGVGIGTYNSEVPLHVYADGFPFATAKVMVENDLSTTETREMLSLVNNGGSGLTFEDTDLDRVWKLGTDPATGFSVSAADGGAAGGDLLTVGSSGRVKMGPQGEVRFDLFPSGSLKLKGSSGKTHFDLRSNGGLKIKSPSGKKTFELKPNGNLKISGTLRQSSDKNLKTAFVDVEATDILDKVASMPVQTWQFIFDEPGLRHMGPTAQDFHAAFGLGEDETTIAPVDGIGVALASIQALDREVGEKNGMIDRLAAELAAQKSLVARQGELLEKLTARLDQMELEIPAGETD